MGSIGSSLLVFDQSHGGRGTHIDCLGLDPLVTHLAVRHIVRILSADFSVVVHLVAQRIRVVPVVDRPLS